MNAAVFFYYFGEISVAKKNSYLYSLQELSKALFYRIVTKTSEKASLIIELSKDLNFFLNGN